MLLVPAGFETHFLYVLFDPDVRRLDNVSRELNVSVDDQRLVRPVGVDAHLAGVDNRLWRGAPLPAQFRVALELTRIRSLLVRERKQEKKCHWPPYTYISRGHFPVAAGCKQP